MVRLISYPRVLRVLPASNIPGRMIFTFSNGQQSSTHGGNFLKKETGVSAAASLNLLSKLV